MKDINLLWKRIDELEIGGVDTDHIIALIINELEINDKYAGREDTENRLNEIDDALDSLVNQLNTIEGMIDLTDIEESIDSIQSQIDNTYTKSQVNMLIESIETGRINMSNYMTRGEIEFLIDQLDERIDFSEYYDKSQIDALLSAVDVDLTDYYTSRDLDIKLLEVNNNFNNFYDKEAIDLRLSESETDLSNYYIKAETELKISESKQDISQFLTGDEIRDLFEHLLTIVNFDYVTLEELLDVLPDTGDFATTQELNTAINSLDIPEIPDVSEFVTLAQVQALIDSIEGADVDLTDYYTKSETNQLINNAETDLTDYMKSDEIMELMDLVFDFVIPDVDGLVTTQELNDALAELNIPEIPNISEFVTLAQVQALVDSITAGDVDLTNYYTKAETDAAIPDVSEFLTAAQIQDLIDGLILPDIEGYVTTQELNDAIAALNIPEIPEIPDVSEFVTLTQVQALIDAIETVDVDLSDYYNQEQIDLMFSELDVIVDLSDYYTKAEIYNKEETDININDAVSDLEGAYPAMFEDAINNTRFMVQDGEALTEATIKEFIMLLMNDNARLSRRFNSQILTNDKLWQSIKRLEALHEVEPIIPVQIPPDIEDYVITTYSTGKTIIKGNTITTGGVIIVKDSEGEIIVENVIDEYGHYDFELPGVIPEDELVIIVSDGKGNHSAGVVVVIPYYIPLEINQAIVVGGDTEQLYLEGITHSESTESLKVFIRNDETDETLEVFIRNDDPQVAFIHNNEAVETLAVGDIVDERETFWINITQLFPGEDTPATIILSDVETGVTSRTHKIIVKGLNQYNELQDIEIIDTYSTQLSANVGQHYTGDIIVNIRNSNTGETLQDNANVDADGNILIDITNLIPKPGDRLIVNVENIDTGDVGLNYVIIAPDTLPTSVLMFTFNEAGDKITGFSDLRPNTLRHIDMPSVNYGVPITGFNDHAFEDNNITSVTFPDSVTSFGYKSFMRNNLTSVTIPDSVTSIGNYAFGNNNLTSVTIPDSVTSLGGYAFTQNRLTSVTIPDSVTILDRRVLANNHLTSVTIPDSVTSIINSAFSNNRLTSVTIPDSVTFIGTYAFNSNRLTSVTIPDSVETIENLAFRDNEGLIIYGSAGSAAANYPLQADQSFVEIP